MTLLSSAAKCADISDKVSKLLLDPPIKSEIQFFTYAVVAICWVLVLEIGVGAFGCPVKLGFKRGALSVSKDTNNTSWWVLLVTI